MFSKSRCFKIFACVPALFLGGLLAGCDVDVQDDDELPTVDVQPGEAPDEGEIRGPEINTESTETELTVPDVDVEADTEGAEAATQQEETELPSVDLDTPEENQG